MNDKDCSSSLIFGIVCQLDRGSINKLEDPSSFKMKWENSDCLTANC